MLLAVLLFFFLSIVVSEDFEELTHRNFYDIEKAIGEIKNLVNYSKSGAGKSKEHENWFYRDCNQTYPGFFRHFSTWNYLQNGSIINAHIHADDHMEFEVKVDEYSLVFDIWIELGTGSYTILRVYNVACRPRNMIEYYAKQVKSSIEKIQKDTEHLTKDWFHSGYNLRFCDGSYGNMFFHDDDILDPEREVIMKDYVSFRGKDSKSYTQVYAYVNGRKLQLEFNMDDKMFTKGRQYPCNGYDEGKRVVFFK